MGYTREDFELVSGLADDFDGTIIDAKFMGNPEYDAVSGTSDPQVTLTIKADVMDKPFTQQWTCGSAKKWTAMDDGNRVESEATPGLHKFVDSSRAGTLVKRIIKLLGSGDVKKGQDTVIARGFLMTEGGFYKGLSFHWKRESMETVGKEVKDVLMPVALISAPKSAPASKAKKEEEPTKVNATAIEFIVGKAEGKTARELKAAVVKELDKNTSGYDGIMTGVLSGSLFNEMVTDGLLTVGPDGKYL